MGSLPAGAPGCCARPGHTWVTSLLPYIEQTAIHGRINTVVPLRDHPRDVVTAILPGLACPSDGKGPVFEDRYSHDNPAAAMGLWYLAAAGPLQPDQCSYCPPGSAAWCCVFRNYGTLASEGGSAPTDVALRGMFGRASRTVSFDQVRDGLSNTLLLGETLPDDCWFISAFATNFNVGVTNIPLNTRRPPATRRISRSITPATGSGPAASSRPMGRWWASPWPTAATGSLPTRSTSASSTRSAPAAAARRSRFPEPAELHPNGERHGDAVGWSVPAGHGLAAGRSGLPDAPGRRLLGRPASATFDIDGAFRATSWTPGDGLVPGTYAVVVDCWQGELISQMLAATGGVQLKAAARLGINRNTLGKKLLEHGLDAGEE